MYLRRFYHEGLGHASYLIACTKTKEAAVIDPSCVITPYLDVCKRENFMLTTVAETHVHADYVSGANKLWRQEDCIWYSSSVGQLFPSSDRQIYVDEHDQFSLGEITFSVLYTPGHTPEHVSYVVYADKGVPIGLFSGDFIFVGDVGRPDLMEKVMGESGSATQSAKEMYSSIQKVSDLPDFLQIWPSHGAGSLCGKALGNIPSTTLGYEKRTNWAFQEKEEDLFVKKLLDGQPDAPPYFSLMKEMNASSGEHADQKKVNECNECNISELNHLDTNEIIAIDTRDAVAFSQQFIDHTINIPYGKAFIQWAGWLIPHNKKVYIIADEKDYSEIKNDLQLIGVNQIQFFNQDEVFSHQLPEANFLSYSTVSARDILSDSISEELIFLDVRNDQEWKQGRIPGAIHVPLGKISEQINDLPHNVTLAVYCHSGFRSAIAVSLLHSSGFHKIVNVAGGYVSYKQEEVCSERK